MAALTMAISQALAQAPIMGSQTLAQALPMESETMALDKSCTKYLSKLTNIIG